MMTAVEEVKRREAYQMSIDMTEYKRCFTNLMATLEAAENEQVDEACKESNNDIVAEGVGCTKTKGQEHKTVRFKTSAASAVVSFVLVNAAALACRKFLKI